MFKKIFDKWKLLINNDAPSEILDPTGNGIYWRPDAYKNILIQATFYFKVPFNKETGFPDWRKINHTGHWFRKNSLGLWVEDEWRRSDGFKLPYYQPVYFTHVSVKKDLETSKTIADVI